MATVSGKQKRRKEPVTKPKVQKGEWLMECPLPRQYIKQTLHTHAQHFAVEIGKTRKVNSGPTEGTAKRIPLGIEFISFCLCPALNLLPSFLPFQPPLRRRGKEERGEGGGAALSAFSRFKTDPTLFAPFCPPFLHGQRRAIFRQQKRGKKRRGNEKGESFFSTG